MYTDEDIAYTERILLPDGKHFTHEHKAFIRHSGNISVQACPGSGKTTSLMSKLLLIERELPFKDGSGVLVLSHTNAAVEEIRRKIADVCPRLFSYPNFVGTIQEFVDKFLGIPGYAEIFGHDLTRVDSEIAALEIKKRFYNVNARVRNSMATRAQRSGAQDVPDYISRFVRIDIGSLSGESKKFFAKGRCIASSPTTDTYKTLDATKYLAIKDGYCSYGDMYDIAFHYIERHPGLKELITKRFTRVYVDEMQDMEDNQYKLINCLFAESSSSIVQLIGDINQAIYHDIDSQSVLWDPEGEVLSLTGTMRLSNSIAAAIGHLGVRQQALRSLNSRSTLKPILVIFNDQNAQDVLPWFGDVLEEKDLFRIAKSSGNRIKAIGWVGKVHENPSNFTISKYFERYKPKRVLNRDFHDRLDDYIASMGAQAFEKGGGKLVAKTLYASIAKLLYISGFKEDIRPYTSTKAKQLIKDEYPLLSEAMRAGILDVASLIARSRHEDAQTSWRSFVVETVMAKLGITRNARINEFIDPGVSLVAIGAEEPVIDTNMHRHEYQEGEDTLHYEIEVSTVHGVKGETHTATLYLETSFNGKHDSERIVNVLLGDRSNVGRADTDKNLKMAYVGMSRATHLVCFAVHESRITEEQKNGLRRYWDIKVL